MQENKNTTQPKTTPSNQMEKSIEEYLKLFNMSELAFKD